jgi:hypothetical protein
VKIITKRIISIILTLTLAFALIFSGPASAVNLKIVVPQDSVEEEGVISFSAKINLSENERIPLQNLTIVIINQNNPAENYSCSFSVNSNFLSNCFNMTINNTINSEYEYGELIGYNESETQNFGYGYGFRHNNNDDEFKYDISWNTPLVNETTTYIIRFYAYVSNGHNSYIYQTISETTFTVRNTKIILEDNLNVNEENTQILLPLVFNETNINISSNINEVFLNMMNHLENNGTNLFVILNNSINVSSQYLPGIDLYLPEGLLISTDSASGWNGLFNLQKILPIGSVTPIADDGYNAQTSYIFEIGSDNISLSLDKAIRILVKNEGGKRAGYVKSGLFHKILMVCTEDNENWANSAITENGECSMTVGNDLVIWTKHLTNFITYTQTQIVVPPPSNGGTPSGISQKGCNPDWDCTSWSSCNIDGVQTRKCIDLNNCPSVSKPSQMRFCAKEEEQIYDNEYKILSNEIVSEEKTNLFENIEQIITKDPKLDHKKDTQISKEERNKIIFMALLFIIMLIVLIAIINTGKKPKKVKKIKK